MEISKWLFFLNFFVNLAICIPIIGLFRGLGNLLFAQILKIKIQEISVGIGPIIFVRNFFVIRIIPFWFQVICATKKRREFFLSYPSEKRYLIFTSPAPRNKYYFEEILFWQKISFLFSGIFANIVLFLFTLLLIFCLNINFNFGVFINSFFSNFFYAFLLLAKPLSICTVNGDINFFRSIITLNLFFLLINFLPVYFLDGYKFFTIIYKKITKKGINWIADISIHACGIFLLTWIFFGFFFSW